MASIHKEVVIEGSPDRVWSALEDIGAIHTRLVPGFVTDTKMEEEDAVRLQIYVGSFYVLDVLLPGVPFGGYYDVD